MIQHSHRAIPWKVLATLAVLLPVAPPFVAGADAAADEPGQGFAFGQGFKVDPKAGGLSIGIAFGQSTAIHTNQVGRGVSTSTNFGVIGLTLGAQNCDGSAATWALGKPPPEGQPEPLIVDSRDDGAAAGKTTTEWGGSFSKSAKASNTPYGEATTIVMGGASPDAAKSFQMGNSLIRTYSGVVSGAREAGATVDLDYLKLGPVFISQLRWEAVHRSTGTQKAEGRFTFGTMTVNGTPQSGPTDKDSSQLTAVNQVLKNLGLRLVPGTVRTSAAGVTVDPLAIVVEPNSTRDTAAKTVLGNETVHRQREDLFLTILETRIPADNKDTAENETRVNGCRAGTYISVADIVMGSVTGAGEFILSFGGAEATTADIPKNSFNLDLGNFGTTPDLDIPGEPALESSFLGTPDIVGGPDMPYVIPVAGHPTPGGPTTRLVNPAVSSRGPTEPFEGARGGALATVGLVTLAVVALVAEGDRRKMRTMLQLQAQAREAAE